MKTTVKLTMDNGEVKDFEEFLQVGGEFTQQMKGDPIIIAPMLGESIKSLYTSAFESNDQRTMEAIRMVLMDVHQTLARTHGEEMEKDFPMVKELKDLMERIFQI